MEEKLIDISSNSEESHSSLLDPGGLSPPRNEAIAEISDNSRITENFDSSCFAGSSENEASSTVLMARERCTYSPRSIKQDEASSDYESKEENNFLLDSYEDITIEMTLPRVNVPEKIIFCVDLSSELMDGHLRSHDGSNQSLFAHLKRSIRLFISTKQALGSHHRFGLMAFDEQARWIHPFTNSAKELVQALDTLTCPSTSSHCDLAALFNAVSKNIKLPVVDGDFSIIPPSYIIRLIIFYGRSDSTPQFIQDQSEFDKLQKSMYFFIDVLYIHDTPSESNQVKQVFDTLCELDAKRMSYVLEMSKKLTPLYNNMARLLAHPMQRPLEKDRSEQFVTTKDVIHPRGELRQQTTV